MTTDAAASATLEHPDVFWEWRAALSPGVSVRTVVAAGGFVAAAGDRLHLIRPGAERVRTIEIPPEMQIAALAVEPRSPFRLGIAWPGHVGVFSGHRPFTPRVEVTFSEPGHDATHLAWGHDDEGSKLFMRQQGGTVLRLDPAGSSDTINAPDTAAIATDESGILALISVVPVDEAAAWILPAGAQEWEVRGIALVPEVDEDDPHGRVELAIHGPAVAFSGGGHAEASWRESDDETQHFTLPPAVFHGPLAFQSDDIVYAAYNVAGKVDVLRWVRGGGVTRIARFGRDDTWEGAPATVTGLAWDGARRTLWAASPELGLIRMLEPGAPRLRGHEEPAPPRLPAGKPHLPDRPDEVWEGGFVMDRAPALVGVSGAGGLVIAGGDALCMLRPGTQTWRQRPPPEELGAVVAVAAEQGPPWRFAVASEGGITLFGLPGDQVVTLAAESREVQVTHLAWGRLGEERVLYIRWDDGGVGRVRLDLGTVEPLSVLPMDAIASDPGGILAMISICRGEPHALVTGDGERFEERPAIAAPQSLPAGSRVHLAVAGAAVAYAIDGWGAHLSRGADDDFVPCPGLLGGGPLAFQGTAPGAALFGAFREKSMCTIHRVDAAGVTKRIVEIEADAGDPPRLVELSWDETRHTLWSASPQAGILCSEEPAGKGGKKRLLS